MPPARSRPPARSGFAVALGVALLAMAGCSGGTDQGAAAPSEVGIVTLTAQAVPISSELTGRTAAVATADVRPQVDGIILQRLFTEGSLVHAGQPLYRIDPRLYKAALATAQAGLENAQATLYAASAKARRYQTLGDKQAVSGQDVDDAVAAARAARASVHQYQAAIQTAKVNLEYTRVLAPITGRIGRSAYTRGALVSASQDDALAQIQQLDPIYVDITQSSADLLHLRQSLAKGTILPASADVTLKLEDGTGYPLGGKVEFSEMSVDPEAGTVTIRARFPNPGALLLPGMFVRVETPQGVIPNGILAPQQGIARAANGSATALVVDAGNKVVQRQVTVTEAIGDKWLVKSGLKAGDRLIVEGTSKVKPGSLVKPVTVKLDD